MIRRIWVISIIMSLIFFSFSGLAYTEEKIISENKEPVKKVLKHVFFITIEGISNKDLSAAYTPNLNSLASNGVKSSAITILPADTACFLGGLLTGKTPDSNDNSSIQVRSLPGVLDSSGRNSVLVDDGREQLRNLIKGVKHINTEGENDYKTIDRATIDKAIKYFDQEHPFFTSIILPGTEYARAKYPPLSTQVMSVLNKADEQVGRLLRHVKNQGIYENTIFVINGSPTSIKKDELNSERIIVPLIMCGPGIKQEPKAPPVKIVDVAPTIAMMAGVSLSQEAEGMVLWNLLQPGDGFLETNLLQKRVKELSEAYIESIKESYLLSNEKQNINLQKEKVNQEKKMIEDRINKKQQEIESLSTKLKAYRVLGGIFFLLALTGYIGEYFLLRKRFLMF